MKLMMRMKYFSFLFFLLFAATANAQIYGCTDPLSTNYNPNATVNNGSCTYAFASVSSAGSVALPASVLETSGLITWGGSVYTHNDNTDTKLYGLNTATGAVMQTITIPGVTNTDWEEIAQDENYIYIGDFGNNNSGNRTNLKIYRVAKASLSTSTPELSIINFSYSNQTNFAPLLGNSTDFDCEAFIVTENNIYLFTKQWFSLKTSVYSLPKTPGTYVANLETTYNVNGLITGATYLEDKKLVVLTGYSGLIQPFVFLLYDFEGNNFFSGNKRKVNISLALSQVEGITTTNGLDYYITNENLVQALLNIPHSMHRLNLRPYLSNYIPDPTVWNGTQWSRGVPNIKTDAIIEGNYNSGINGEITASSLTINSGDVTIISGSDITVKHAVKIAQSATLTIENNANLIQIENRVNTGSAFVEKRSNPLYNLDYTLWSSPVAGGQTLKEFSPNTLDNRFYVYNPADSSFDNYQSEGSVLGGNPADVMFTPAKGYLIRMPAGLPASTQTVFEGVFEGTPNNGTVTIPLGTTGGRFNAVGNPYPSPVSIYEFIDQNQASLENGTLYFWRKTNNPDATSYATINKLAYIANAAAGGDTGNGIFSGNAAQWVINPGQGFFVKASASAGSLVFKNSMRRTVNNGQFFRMNNEADTAEAVSRLWLNLENASGEFSQIAVGYTEHGTTGLDFGFDGLLLSDGEASLFTLSGETKLAIQARPQYSDEDVVQVGFTTSSGGNYTITLSNFDGVFAQGQEIFIKDNQLDIVHNLTGGAYSFTTDAGTVNNRFDIVYKASNLEVNDTAAVTEKVVIFKKDNMLHIDAGDINLKDVTVYDISGRKVYNRSNINATNTTLGGLQAVNQVVLVQITTEDNTVVTKKVIN